jgi:hypothetical protein
MPQTLQIPLTTFDDGVVHEYGPYTLKQQDNVANITIDRTITGGLNSVTSDVTGMIEIDFSVDNGQTWTLLAGSGFEGGLVTWIDRFGVQHTINAVTITVGTDLVRGAQLRGTAVVHGASVNMTGTVNFTS